jgi:O-antigen/teichoic acid export membrane protein
VNRFEPSGRESDPALAAQDAEGSEPLGTEVGPARRPSFVASAAETFGTNVAVAVLSLVNVLITARALGAVGRGEIAFLTTISLLSANVALLGVQEANANFAGSDSKLRPSLVTNSVVLAVVFGTVTATAVGLLITIFPSTGGEVTDWIRWVALAAIPVLVLQTYLQLLAQADYGFRVTNLAWLLGPVVNVVVNGALAAGGVLSVQSAVATWIAGQAVATGFVLWSVLRAYGFAAPSRPLAARAVAFGLKSHLGRVMMLGNYRLDQWLLGILAGPRELGIYSVAVVWSETLFFLPTAVATVQRPDLVRASSSRAAQATATIFRGSVLLTAAAGLVLFAVAPALCVGLFGDDFRDSAVDLRILVFGAIGIVALKQLGSALTAQRRPLLSTAGIAVALVTTVALDFALIPPYGAVGAAVASSLAYTAGGVAITLIFLRVLSGGGRLVPGVQDAKLLARQLRVVFSRLGSR